MGQIGGEARAALRIVARREVAALRQHEAACDRQSEPEPARPRRATPAELLEKRCAQFRRNPRPAILHANINPLAPSAPFEAGAHEDWAAGRRVQAGVEQQIAEHLLHKRRVNPEQRQVRRHPGRETPSRQRFARRLPRRRDQVAHIAPVRLRPQPARLEACLVQQVRDEVIQPARCRPNLARQTRALRRIVRVEFVAGRAQDGERRFQFVGNAVEQRAVQPVRFREEFLAFTRRAQLFALDQQRDLRRESLDEIALHRREFGHLQREPHRKHAEDLVGSPHRNVQPLGVAKHPGKAPRIPPVVGRPFGHSVLLLVQAEGAGGMRRQPALFARQQQRCLRVEKIFRLAQRRGHGLIERTRPCQRAGQVKQHRGPLLAQALLALLGPNPRGQLSRNDGHHEVNA